FQTIAFFMEETGEYGEQELSHSDGEAERFYRDLQQRGIHVRVGMEATGYSRWFERLLAELGFEVWMGDPAEIKAKRVKKQKFDREDARLLLRLMRENNFPQIWVPGPENRDLRHLLWHRHRIWRCVDTRALPRSRWGGNWRYACIGCGGMVVRLRRPIKSGSVLLTWSLRSSMVVTAAPLPSRFPQICIARLNQLDSYCRIGMDSVVARRSISL